MTRPMAHEDVMELAVQLTCSYLGSSHSASTDAEELILTYYRQLRNVEARLGGEYPAEGQGEEEEEAGEGALQMAS
jgi:hypothetical protein